MRKSKFRLTGLCGFVLMLAACNSSGLLNKYPLITAAGQGDVQAAEELLRQNSDVNLMDSEQQTALMEAAANGHIEIVKLLVANGADINTANKSGNTAVMVAVEKGHTAAVEFLIDAGADLSKINKEKHSALHLAAKSSNMDLIKLLIRKGAPVDYPDSDALSPLLLAVGNLDKDALALLLENGADVNFATPEGVTALHLAAHRAAPDLMQLLLASGGDIKAKNTTGEDAFLIFCGAEYAGIMNNLFDRIERRHNSVQGVPGDLPQKHNLPSILPAIDRFNNDLSRTAMKSILEIIDNSTLAIEIPDADFDAVAEQLERDYAAVSQMLLDAGADINTTDRKKRSAIIRICSGNDRLTEIFKKKSIPVNPGIQKRLDAGLLVAKRIHQAMLSMLIARGADANLPDENGQTPLMSACENGHVEYVTQLVGTGIPVNQAHKDGWTPLTYAVSSEEIEIAEFLLSRGANVNAANIIGETALLLAVNRNNEVLVEKLMAYGADPAKKNLHGNSPRSVAQKKGYAEILKMME